MEEAVKEHWRDEKVDGVVCDMSPAPGYQHGIINGNIYERAGVEEYWIVLPQGKSLDIYYLEEGKYVLEQSHILQDDEEEENYNAQTSISLRAFPNITMTLAEIFEGVE